MCVLIHCSSLDPRPAVPCTSSVAGQLSCWGFCAADIAGPSATACPSPLSRLAGQVNEVPGSRVRRSAKRGGSSHIPEADKAERRWAPVRPCPCRAVSGSQRSSRRATCRLRLYRHARPTDATPGLGHLGWTLSSSLPSAASPHLAPGTWHPAKPHPAPTPGFRATTPPSYKPCGSRCPFRPRPQGPASHARAHTHTRPSPFALTDLSGPSSSPAPE